MGLGSDTASGADPEPGPGSNPGPGLGRNADAKSGAEARMKDGMVSGTGAEVDGSVASGILSNAAPGAPDPTVVTADS